MNNGKRYSIGNGEERSLAGWWGGNCNFGVQAKGTAPAHAGIILALRVLGGGAVTHLRARGPWRCDFGCRAVAWENRFICGARAFVAPPTGAGGVV